MAGKKSTKAEYNERLSYTAKLIGEGKYRYQIVEILTTQYDISVAMADKYIGDVYENARESYKNSGEDLLARYNELYQKAIDDDNKKLAKEILDSITKLTQVKKVDVTTNGESINYSINFTLAEPKKEDE